MRRNHLNLRHITKKEYLPSIISKGALMEEYSRRPGDNKHISFEENPWNDVLLEKFDCLKQWGKEDPFQLIFDGVKLNKAGYKVLSDIDGKLMTKIELDIICPEIQSEGKISDKVGEFVFIKNRVPLRFLTNASKGEVRGWAYRNNISENEVEQALRGSSSEKKI